MPTPCVVPPRQETKPRPTRSLSVRELSSRWHVHPETICRAIRRGDLIAFTPGKRRYRITPDEIVRVERLRGW